MAGRDIRAIAERESIYLDLLRSLAALAVLVDHTATLFNMSSLPRPGHESVILFFVLSGYVISNVADTRERDASSFIISRLARLWSVLIPALVLTVICDTVGRTFGHDMSAYRHAPLDHPFVRLGAALTFLSESWVSIQPLSNGVFWSLCAEFWYYMIFAAWTFAPPGRKRIALVTIAALFAGHKGLLLLPIWGMGVMLQRARILRPGNFWISLTLFVSSLAGITAAMAYGAYPSVTKAIQTLVNPWVFQQLAQARAFPFDWLFGALIAVHLLGARQVVERMPLETIAAPIRWCASISFAAYLFHQPIVDMCGALLGLNQGWAALSITLIIIACVGRQVEKTKYHWKRALTWLVQEQALLWIMQRVPVIQAFARQKSQLRVEVATPTTMLGLEQPVGS